MQAIPRKPQLPGEHLRRYKEIVVSHAGVFPTIPRTVHNGSVTRCPRCQRRVSRSGCKVHGRPSVADDAVDVTPPPVVAPSGWKLGRPIAIGGSAFVYEVTAGSGAPAALKWGRWRDH